MRRALLFLVTPAIFIGSGCKKASVDSQNYFVEESDAVFHGARKKHVLKNGYKNALYYFEGETVNSLARKVEASKFFQEGGWSNWKRSNDGKMIAARRDIDGYESPNLLFIFEGHVELDGDEVGENKGATLNLSGPKGR